MPRHWQPPAGWSVTPQVRNWGTIGGNVAHADPASDPPTVLVAYGASIHTHGVGGSRSISAEDYFIDLFTTDLQEGELISTIEIPGSGDKKSAYTKLAHPASRYAVVGVCVVLEMDGATCSGARVAVGGATPKATRSQAAEAALAGTSLDDRALDAAANALLDDIGDELLSDIYASEAYRKAMAGVYLKRAVRSALG